MRELTLGYSPCPNDTFIFYGLVHGKVPGADIRFRERLEDVETLNQLALDAALDLTKISFHAFGHLRRDYCLLRSGSALGRGCGPLLITRDAASVADLKGRTIAIPGRLTTANLLLQLCLPDIGEVLVLPFEQIMMAVKEGRAAAGVIIHESRFTYPRYGLKQLMDLGQWWEEDSGHPIPLGGILAKRSLGTALTDRIDSALRASIDYAHAHPEAVRDYIRRHAQELDDEVTRRHIDLYVNDFSRDLGDAGLAAIRYLLDRAEKQGIIPPCDLPLTTAG